MVKAATPNGSDNAANYAGLTDYKNVNGGSDFIAGFSGSGTSFLGSSPDINTSGLSFGLSSGTVSRTFGQPGSTPSYALSNGQTFSFQLESGTVGTGGSYGLTLRNAQSTGTTFNFFYTGGSADYSYSVRDFQFPAMFVTRTVDTGIPFNARGVTVAFTQNSGTFSLAITPVGSSTTTLTDTYVGAAFAIDVNANNAGNVYFNNLVVVPEPGTWAILTAGSLGMLGFGLVRRRRA